MAQGTTNFPAALDTARVLPSNMDSSEAAILAMQAHRGILRTAAADGAISPAAGEVVLTKETAGAYTLAAPASDGFRLCITSGTAAAHVVTATGLIEDGVTGGAKDTMTFAAFPGASIDLLAYDGKWHVVAKNVVTVAAA